MKINTIPRTGTELSDIGFGGASLGNLYRETDEQEGACAVAAAYDAGITYFDTAPHYGLGLSERRLGAALANYRREKFTVSTKVGRALEPNPEPTGSDLEAGGFAVPDDLRRRWDFSADGVRRSIEESLGRLGLDRLDIVYVHDPDNHADQAINEAIPALITLREQGVVGAVGIGMNQVAVPLRAVQETDLDVVMLANRWTLLDRSGRNLLDVCAERNVAVVAAAPFNSGLLASARPPANAMYDYQPAPQALLAQVNAMADVCERWNVSLPEAAVQFPLRHPAVVSVVAGLRDQTQVGDLVDRREATIPSQAWAELGS